MLIIDFSKNNNTKWHCFNDRMVFEITNLITPDAYILCYKLADENQIDTSGSNVITIDTSNNQDSDDEPSKQKEDNSSNIHISKSDC